MIYYFSATGNSRHVAKRLSERLGEKMLSILDVKQPIKVKSEERFILVYPNYCGGLPSVVLDFLKNGKFQLENGARLELVVTYGNNTGASTSIASKYLKKNTGRTFDALYSVKMPDNQSD